MNSFDFYLNNYKVDDVLKHFIAVNNLFTPSLDSYVDLEKYADKICNKAFTLGYSRSNDLIALCALYINSKTCYVTNFSIKKEYHKTGLSILLMKKLLAFCEFVECEIIELEVIAENINAVKFYYKFGFVQVGSIPFMTIYNKLLLRKFI